MGRYFDAAYDHAMSKLAFDVDDEEDKRVYEAFNALPTKDSHIKRISNDFADNAALDKKIAIGTGIGALGSGAVGLAFKKARPVAFPLAGALGLASAGSALGSLMHSANKSAYDSGGPEYRRKVNLDDYMSRHGSQYGGRREQVEADRQLREMRLKRWQDHWDNESQRGDMRRQRDEMRRQRYDDFRNADRIADAIRDAHRAYYW